MPNCRLAIPCYFWPDEFPECPLHLLRVLLRRNRSICMSRMSTQSSHKQWLRAARRNAAVGHVLGDRFGKVIDPFGHHWNLATHIEDVAPAEDGTPFEGLDGQMASMAKAAGQS